MKKIVCEKCKSKNRVSRKNCWICGVKLNKENTIEIKNFPIYIVVATTLVLTLMILGYLIFSNNSNKEGENSINSVSNKKNSNSESILNRGLNQENKLEISEENMKETTYVRGTYSINSLFDENQNSRKSQVIGGIYFGDDGNIKIKFGILYYNAYTTSQIEYNGKFGKINDSYYICVYGNFSNKNYYKFYKLNDNKLKCELVSGFDIVGNTNKNLELTFESESDIVDNLYIKGKEEVTKLADKYKSESIVENNTIQQQVVTLGMKNALETAKQYLSSMPFSYKGLIEQLEYEGYTHEEAVYGVDNCGTNWNIQAYEMSKQYLDTMPFSKQGLIEQLEYEGFTDGQIQYALEKIGY